MKKAEKRTKEKTNKETNRKNLLHETTTSTLLKPPRFLRFFIFYTAENGGDGFLKFSDKEKKTNKYGV
jgi:hypothetical protein